MKESIFQRGEKGPSIAKRIAEIKKVPGSVGDIHYYREAQPEAKHEVYAATAHVIRATHQGIEKLLHNSEQADFLNGRFFVDQDLPYRVSTEPEASAKAPLSFAPPPGFESFPRDRFMTVITNAENLYGDLFYHVVNRGERFFSDDDQQIFRGLQSVIGATKYHGATPQTVDNFLMGGVTNASSDIWGAYLALNHEHHKQFGEPMKPEDFQSVAEDLSRIFLKLSSLQFDTLLALMLAQKGERGVSHTISQHNAEADVERYRRMLKLHKKEEGLHVDIDLEYLESFNKDLNTFPPAGEKRYGCPARSISVTKEDGTVNPVIPDLVEFYAEIASITLPPVAEKLKEALDFYDENRARFMGRGAFSDPLPNLP